MIYFVGYGITTPNTNEGKIVTIIYAIIGMPLFLLYLSNIGDVLAKSFRWIYAKVCLCRICPGVAKRRAYRIKRKIRALTRDIDDFDVCFPFLCFFFSICIKIKLINNTIFSKRIAICLMKI